MALLVCIALSSLIMQGPTSSSGLPMMSPGTRGTFVPSAPNTSASPFDEQVGVTFTQNYSMLAFNVSAVAYTDNGIGPGFLVNGLTDQGYWYQVGLSYNWPLMSGAVNPGFNMNYEVFSPGPSSIYPADGGGGLQPFNGTVNTGDSVLLSLSFSQASVVMKAIDWQTRSVSQQSYPAYSDNKVFVGLASTPAQSDGFFSGLMTEQYHYTPFYGSGTPVTYTVSGPLLQSVWMWMDEWNTDTHSRVFAANTTSPVLLDGASGTYFASNGTAEIATTHSFVTGLTPVIFPKLVAGLQSTGQPGHQASINLEVEGQNGATLHFENVTVSTSFAKYYFSLGVGQNILTISVPSSLTLGTYDLTINIKSWEYLDIQAQIWVPLRPDSANETLLVTDHPAPSTNSGPGSPSSGRAPSSSTHTTKISLYSIFTIIRSLIIPAIGSYIALGVLAIGLLIRRNRKRSNIV